MKKAAKSAAEADVLTDAEAAALLRVNVKTVRRMAARKAIPHFRVGRMRRYWRPVLVDLMAGGKGDAGDVAAINNGGAM